MSVSSPMTVLSVPIDAGAADVPFLIDAALNPGKDPIGVAGLRLHRWHLMARTLVPTPYTILCASHEHSESTAQTDGLKPS